MSREILKTILVIGLTMAVLSSTAALAQQPPVYRSPPSDPRYAPPDRYRDRNFPDPSRRQFGQRFEPARRGYGFNGVFPGVQVGLPPTHAGELHDLYWDPVSRVFEYRNRGVESGLQFQEQGSAIALWWDDLENRGAAEVSLFLADADQTVIAVQSLPAPPWGQSFIPPFEAIYAGVTIEWLDGTVSTTVIPFR